MKHGVAVTDVVCGMNATQAILAALLMRARTGEGQFIDIALLDGALALLANVGSGYLNTGGVPARHGNSHPTVVPYGIFAAADGEFVLGCGNDRQFRATCTALGQPGLADDLRFLRNLDRQANRAVLVSLLTGLFASHPAQHWVERLMAADVPAAMVRTVPQALGAPEVSARGLVEIVHHPTAGPVSLVASPLRLEGMPAPSRPPPLLGQDTRAVLHDRLGRTDRQLDALFDAGIVVEP